MPCSKPSIFATSGREEKDCVARCHEVDISDKWCTFFSELHSHPCFQSLKNSTPSAPKKTNFDIKSPLDNPPIVAIEFISMVVRL